MCGNRYNTGVPHSFGKGCQYSGAVSEAVIERYLLIHIRPLLEAHTARIRISNRQIIDYKSKIKSINAKLSRLKDLYIDGFIFLDTYAAMPKVKKRELWQMLPNSIELGSRPEMKGKAYNNSKITFV